VAAPARPLHALVRQRAWQQQLERAARGTEGGAGRRLEVRSTEPMDRKVVRGACGRRLLLGGSGVRRTDPLLERIELETSLGTPKGISG
jgi:hypothetical protein